MKIRNAKKLSRFNKILLWINYLFIICLLGSIASKYISPINFWALAFLGLAFPIIVLVNIIFATYWFAQFRVHGFFSIIAIFIGARTMLGFIQFDVNTGKVSNKDIKVMSYNSMLFDLYNWSKNKQSRDIILNSLYEENPDILCLQEFYTSEDSIRGFNNVDTLTKLLNAKNYHVEYTTTLRKHDHWGVATFTKYPIIRKGKIDFNTSKNNVCIYTDVIINTDTVRVYNMHLQSISFNKVDYKFIDEIKNDTIDTKDEVEKSKNIMRRLKRAFVKRATQADIIAAHIASCNYKIILCGDFNDTPASYVYRTVSNNLKDAFIESGSGFEQTYAGKFPRFRIDYILYSPDFESKNYHHISETLTDHYPVITFLSTK